MGKRRQTIELEHMNKEIGTTTGHNKYRTHKSLYAQAQATRWKTSNK